MEEMNNVWLTTNYILWGGYLKEYNADTTDPLIHTLTPEDNATGININSSLLIKFDETIVLVDDDGVTLHKTSDDSQVAATVTALTDTVTINPTASFGYSTGYYVLIDASAIEDTSGNGFAGISSKTTYNFTSAADLPAQDPYVIFHDETYVETPDFAMDLKARVFNKDYICVVVNPNKFLRKQRIAHGHAWIARTEQEDSTQALTWARTYEFWKGWLMVNHHYLPDMVSNMRDADHWTVDDVAPTVYGMWQQVVGGHRTDPVDDWGYLYEGDRGAYRPVHNRSDVATDCAFYCYIKMPTSMVNGNTYTVEDAYGNSVDVEYHEDTSHSWAMKVNQVGYLTDAKKYGYLGMWLGPDLNGLDFSGYSNDRFDLKRVSDDVSVYNGTIDYRLDDAVWLVDGESTTDENAYTTAITGEHKQYEMDFSSYTTVGEYYLQADGIGKSWPFKIDTPNNIYGDIFYWHSRALMHQRGQTNLSATYTEWPFDSNYFHSENDGLDTIKFYECPKAPTGISSLQQGTDWGWYDVTDDLWYQDWTITKFGTGHSHQMDFIEQALDGYDAEDDDTNFLWSGSVKGGWHDAADYDRREKHLRVTTYQAIAYLLNSAKFTDNQLNLPESGDGIPDILSNAIQGVEWIKDLQDEIGTGAVVITAEQSQDRRGDYGPDQHKFFTGEPTRVAAYEYAYTAAIFGKALLVAGATTLGNSYITSAEDAYDWAEGQTQTILGDLTRDGHTIRWYGRPDTSDDFKHPRLWSTIALRIATEDSAYLTTLNNIGTTYWNAHMESQAIRVDGQNNSAGGYRHVIDMTLITKYSSLLPTAWDTKAIDIAEEICDKWQSNFVLNFYRQPWKGEGVTWGGSSWDKRSLSTGAWDAVHWGWRSSYVMALLLAGHYMTGTASYKENALIGMDYYLGCNPSGRTQWSGIGSSSLYTWLVGFPSPLYSRGEYPRGYETYGGNMLIAKAMVAEAAYASNCYMWREADYGDLQIPANLTTLPKPMTENMTWDSDINNRRFWFADIVPWARRHYMNEGKEVAQNEFTIDESQIPAIFCSSYLIDTGYTPSTATKTIARRTEDEMWDSLYYQP